MYSFDKEKLPINVDFISTIPDNSVKKSKHCGWDIDKTLFLEASYVIGTSAGSVILKDYENRVYYTALIFTKPVVKRLNFKELRVLVDHEKWEFDELVENANSRSRDEFSTHFEEEKRHEPELQRLYDTHGKEFAVSTIEKSQKIVNKKPFINRTVGIYWLYLFVINNFHKLKEYAFDMTEAMLSDGQKKGFFEVIDRTEKLYGSDLPVEEVMPFILLKGKYL